MKKLYRIIAALSVAVVVWACGPAESGYTQEHYLQGLYTVNKATVAPEFSDTAFFVRNIESFDLKTGDHALLYLHFYYDAYSGVAPQWNIKEVIKKISVYPLSNVADVDSAAYTTPITGLQALNFFNSFEAKSWIWNGRQNICIKYKGVEKDASFAMTVLGVKDGYVELELFVNAPESNVETSTLLNFELSDIADFLSPEDKALLPDSIKLPEDVDKLKTKIYTKRMKNGALEYWAVPGSDIVYF